MPPSRHSAEGSRSKTGRSRRNVTQACFNCRTRKKKCDGEQPCATCVLYKDECVWSSRDDWRKPLSKNEANVLRSRVDELEKEVDEYRQRLATATETSSKNESLPIPLWQPTRSTVNLSSPLPNVRQTVPQTGSSRHGPTQSGSLAMSFERCFAVDSHTVPQVIQPPRGSPVFRDGDDVEEIMVQDDRGQLSVHNPTSAFHHVISKIPNTRVDARDIKRLANENDPKRFARFLPDVYLTKLQHDTAMDRVFRYFAPFGQRITPHLFYRDMEIALSLENEADLPQAAPNYSPLAHNVIIALGLGYAEEDHLRALSTRRMFNEQANKHLDRELSTPCLATVQALALRSSFPSTVGDYSVGWMNNGLAIRMCFALGLHVDTSALVARGKLTHETWVQRNVTFWSTFAQEEMWAIYIGRTPLMDSRYVCPPPVADPVTDSAKWTWPTGPFENSPPQPSYLSLTFVHTVSLLRIATDISNTLYTGRFHKADLVENGTVQRFRDALDEWLEKLPSELLLDPLSPVPSLPHIIMLNQSWAWIVILLFQPFSQVAAALPSGQSEYVDFGKYAMGRCHQEAIKINQLALVYHAQHGLKFTPPTMAPIIYTAGTTFLLAAAQAVHPSQVAVSLDKVHVSLNMLREIGWTWEAGNQKADILDDLLRKYTQASVDITGIAGDVHSTRPPHDAGPSNALLSSLDEPLPLPQDTAFDTVSWSGDQSLDQFIQSLFSQNTLPIGGDIDLMALLQQPAE